MAFDRRAFLGLGLSAVAVASMPRILRAAEAGRPVVVTPLAEHLYLVQAEGGNQAVLTGADGLLLVDASYLRTVPAVLGELGKLSHDAPDLLINTHCHGDHTGGNPGYRQAGYRIVATRQTRERLLAPKANLLGKPDPMPSAGLPTVTFDHQLTLLRSAETVQLEQIAPAHTDTDLFVHFHTANVLHVGDTWFNGIFPFIDEAIGGSIGGMIAANERALAIADSATRIIPGHGPVGTRAGLVEFRDLLVSCRERVLKLKTAGRTEAEVVAANPLGEFDARWGHGLLTTKVFTGIVYRTV